MLKKDTINTERAMELEMWLLENCSAGMSNHELLDLLISQQFRQKEIQYLINAYCMPLNTIRQQLLACDTARLCMDELTFITGLQLQYNCNRDVIMQRIRYVRSIDRYLRENPDIIFPDIQVYGKLVRDNIPNIIESNGEKPIYHQVSDEEYWDYLIKKDSEELEEVRRANSKEEIKEELSDKLEIIRAMAIYHGFTLDDIIREANFKEEKKGGFSKRFVLERVYNYQNKK